MQMVPWETQVQNYIPSSMWSGAHVFDKQILCVFSNAMALANCPFLVWYATRHVEWSEYRMKKSEMFSCHVCKPRWVVLTSSSYGRVSLPGWCYNSKSPSNTSYNNVLVCTVTGQGTRRRPSSQFQIASSTMVFTVVAMNRRWWTSRLPVSFYSLRSERSIGDFILT
jgi:hypothetical protein